MESVGIVPNTIAATMRTEGLLAQFQLLTAEIQAREAELTTKQAELHPTNEELQEKAQLLENEKKQVEDKNLEVELARRAFGEKAEELALTSKYVGVPGQHEPSTGDATQLAPHPVEAPDIEPEGQPRQVAGGVRAKHQLGGGRPAEPHHRHPRPFEERGREGHH
jgi:hypothetical protein